jgi:hypothetical protein
MRKLTGMFALAVAASTAAAQGGAMGGMKMDETKKVTQVGPLPTGWMERLDRPNLKAEDLNFTTMGSGLHVTTGPAAIFWNPANTASGTYAISAQFGVRSMPQHDAYGLIWGGTDLSGDKESYAYFIVYGDGSFTVKHRAGANSARVGGDVHEVVPKTDNAAINKAPDNGGVSNALEVRLGTDSVRFFANGKQVGAVDAKNPMMPNAGVYGFRVNHNIDVHVGGFGKK